MKSDEPMEKAKIPTKFDALMENEKIVDWLEEADIKPATENSYVWSMVYFTEFTGKAPEELIREAKREQKEGVDMDERKVRSYLNKFRKDMVENQKLAPLSVRTRMVGVRSFYCTFYVDLPKLKRTGKAKPLAKNVKDIPEKADIQEVLKYCCPLERAIILVGCSSGLAAAEIINLRIQDFENGYDPETQITTLRLRREKVEYDFFTFLTPECGQSILDYLAFRERKIQLTSRNREKMEPVLEKQKITRREGFLFVQKNIPKSYLTIQPEEIDMSISQKDRDAAWMEREKIRQVDEGTLMHMFQRISARAQKCTPQGCWNLIRTHNMRKVFSSTLKNAGCEHEFVEYWMAHQQDDVRGAYDKYDPKKLILIYQQYIPLLTFAEELNVFDNPNYKDLLEQNKTLAKMAADSMLQLETLKKNQKKDIDDAVKKRMEEIFDSVNESLDSAKKSEQKFEIDWSDLDKTT